MSGEDEAKTARLSEKDRERAAEMGWLKAPVIYESIRLEGEHELSRPSSALWWSGVAAGVGISASVLCKAFLHAATPADAAWAPAVDNIGYTVGFLIVLMGRLQLFTENTITVILPLLQRFNADSLRRVARLWGIVFGANMVGCAFAALVIARLGVLPEPQLEAVMEISRHYASASFREHLAWGAPAGFLIAALVWVLPSVDGAGEFWMIAVVTYMIGLGGLSHVVAGSTELFVLVFTGELSLLGAVFGCVLPALLGNIIGGTGLFAMMAFAQVREEL
jgi:formate/nitrite transporter FocA (FNT family)